MLVAWLVHRPWSFCLLLFDSILIQARARHLKLQALAIEDLVVVESRRGGIEADAFATDGLVVASPCAMLTPHISILNASDLIFNSKRSLLVVHMFAMITLCHDFAALASMTFQNADARVCSRVRHVKPICCGAENCIAHCLFLG
jgi:hypothetical protein